jgi:large subunit ribosomal protein L35Ae
VSARGDVARFRDAAGAAGHASQTHDAGLPSRRQGLRASLLRCAPCGRRCAAPRRRRRPSPLGAADRRRSLPAARPLAPSCSAKRNQKEAQSIIKLENVNDAKAARWYAGKRVAYIYKAKTEKNGSKLRVIWGRVSRPHGTIGAVRAKFAKNLPPRSLGGSVRIMLFPSNI